MGGRIVFQRFDVAVANCVAILPPQRRLDAVLDGSYLALLVDDPYCAKFKLLGCGEATIILRSLASTLGAELAACRLDPALLSAFDKRLCEALAPLLANRHCAWTLATLCSLFANTDLRISNEMDRRRRMALELPDDGAEFQVAKEFEGLLPAIPELRSLIAHYPGGAFTCEVILNEGQPRQISGEFRSLNLADKMRYMASPTCIYFSMVLAPQLLRMDGDDAFNLLRRHRIGLLCAYFSMSHEDLLEVRSERLFANFFGKMPSGGRRKQVTCMIAMLLDSRNPADAIAAMVPLFAHIFLWREDFTCDILGRTVALACLAIYRFHSRNLVRGELLQLLRSVFTQCVDVPYELDFGEYPEHRFLLPGAIPLQMRMLLAAFVPQWVDFVLPDATAIDAATFSQAKFAAAIEHILRTAFPNVIGFDFPTGEAIRIFAERNYQRLLDGELQLFQCNWIVNGQQARLFLLLFRTFFSAQNRICCFCEKGSFVRPLFFDGEIHRGHIGPVDMEAVAAFRRELLAIVISDCITRNAVVRDGNRGHGGSAMVNFCNEFVSGLWVRTAEGAPMLMQYGTSGMPCMRLGERPDITSPYNQHSSYATVLNGLLEPLCNDKVLAVALVSNGDTASGIEMLCCSRVSGALYASRITSGKLVVGAPFDVDDRVGEIIFENGKWIVICNRTAYFTIG
ncbi:MAG: hypothetical protein LBB38_00730 [Puniceicoccales bacterium]|nr:hypothetical protein [Puniceicoccales bacterium]